MLIPNIQLFAEGDAGPADGNGGNNGGGEPANNTPATYTQEQLDTIVTDRTNRATKSALASFFKQKGLSEEDANKAIDAYLEQKAKNTPDVSQMQSQIDTANNARRVAEVNQLATFECIKQGVDSKSIPYVLKMADFNGVAKTDGTYNAEKLTAAITKVLEDVPAFKGTAQDEGNNGIQKIGGDGNNSGGNTKVTTGGVPSKRWNKFNN